MAISNFFPQVSNIIDQGNLPEPIKDVVNNVFGKLHYKSFYTDHSAKGDTFQYGISLVFNEVGLNLFGADSGFSIVLNPSAGGLGITEVPLSVYINIPILKYVNDIKLSELNGVQDL
jgi:hypothetical protein